MGDGEKGSVTEPFGGDVSTQNVARLAREGVDAFDHPVIHGCSPTRAAEASR